MKERILILSLGRTGSLPLFVKNIVENFEFDNYDFYVSKNCLESYPDHAKKIKTYTNKLSFLTNSILFLPFYICVLIPKIIFKYKVLYVGYKHFWDLPVIFLFKIFRKKIVFTVHDGILHTGERNFISQSMNNIRLKLATDVIFLTEYVKKKVENKISITARSYIVPHPLIINKFIKHSKNQGDRTKNLLFFGRIDKYKGIELLMKGAVEAEEHFDKLIIAGKSNYAIDYVTHDKIEIVDKYLSEKEIGELFNWSDVLILPYTEATQSGVIALGIYAQKPMICTSVGGFSEQLNEDECFWCEPNVDSISKAIKEALSNEKKIIKIKNKLKLKKEELSWEKAAEKIEKILVDML